MINLGSKDNKKEVKVGALLYPNVKKRMVELLKEYVDVFDWSDKDIPGYDIDIVEHRLPIQPGKRPVKQHPRRFVPEITIKIKQEIERLLKSRFITTARYVEWLANIVHVIKKNRTLRIYIARGGDASRFGRRLRIFEYA